MALITQPSWVLYLNSINGVSSSKTNLFSSTTFKVYPFKTPKLIASATDSNAESSSPKRTSEDEPVITDPVKLAFARAKAYKKSKQSDLNPKPDPFQKAALESVEIQVGNDGSVSDNISGGAKEIPVSIKLSTEKTREYKNNGGVASSSIAGEKEKISGLGDENVVKSGDEIFEKKVSKKKESKVSRIDFVGFNFSDKKKSRGLPAGLVPAVDPFSDGDLPEVELIVGDISKFAPETPLEPDPTVQEDDSDVYKPKVSTWGVFPRPSNISKTFGGGRTIQPGEILETSENKAAKDARTRKLLAAYKNKMGLVIDPKLKSECEKALKEGDDLMDAGKLKQALPYYEKVMKDLAFETELHGQAALQWSICQDSLCRQAEARVMYEKLQSHPNGQVRKKADQFMFSFQAMEMMKVKSLSLSTITAGYRNYFDAFVDDKPSYPPRVGEEEEQEQGALSQTLPYVIFLLSPILIVLLIALRKGV